MSISSDNSSIIWLSWTIFVHKNTFWAQQIIVSFGVFPGQQPNSTNAY